MLSRDHELSVEWSDEDQAYVGYCRDLFPYGGVCHDENRIAAYAKLVELVEWHLQDEMVGHDKNIKLEMVEWAHLEDEAVPRTGARSRLRVRLLNGEEIVFTQLDIDEQPLSLNELAEWVARYAEAAKRSPEDALIVDVVAEGLRPK